MGPVSIGVEVQRNTDGDTPSIISCDHVLDKYVVPVIHVDTKKKIKSASKLIFVSSNTCFRVFNYEMNTSLAKMSLSSN